MFTIVAALMIMDRTAPQKAEALVRWFDPAILWIQRWLGAFYVPSLAMLPLTIQGIAGKLCTWPLKNAMAHMAMLLCTKLSLSKVQVTNRHPAYIKGDVFDKGTVWPSTKGAISLWGCQPIAMACLLSRSMRCPKKVSTGVV